MKASVFSAGPGRAPASSAPIRSALRRVRGDDVRELPVAARDRRQQLLVVADVRPPWVLGVMAEEHARLGGERFVGAVEAWAADEPHELLVEAEVGRDHVLGRTRLALRRRSEVGHRLVEAGEVERLVAAEDADRNADLDHLARDVHVEPVARGEREDERARGAACTGEPSCTSWRIASRTVPRLVPSDCAGGSRAGGRPARSSRRRSRPRRRGASAQSSRCSSAGRLQLSPTGVDIRFAQ